MKLQSGLEIVSLEKQLGQVNLKSPVRHAEVSFDKDLPRRVSEVMQSSQWNQLASQNKNLDFNFRAVSDILPREEDYIFVNFRALSKVLVAGHWLDWTRDGVLEEGVSMLEGATVYPNHHFWNIYNWLGSVSQTSWDESGAKFGGVPGINATYKIDALVSPIIARGLLMKPPAIHSTSLTVLFEFEFSHPDIATEDRWKFFRLLGEEVDGHIVRLVVTKLHEIWEASLVYQGADRIAKQAKDDDEEDFNDDSLSAEKTAANSLSALPAPNTNDKEKTMKLTKEQKAALGITEAGEEFSENQILERALELAEAGREFEGVNLTELKAKAEVADSYVEEKRTEVRRLARLAELGAEEGELDEVISEDIESADYARLSKLQDHYQKKAADKFPASRSSQESADEIETAGGVKTEQQSATVTEPVTLH